MEVGSSDLAVNKRSKNVPETSLAFVESLTFPPVQEVVLSADFQCKDCREKIAHFISKINGETESIVVSVLDKKITLVCKYPIGITKASILGRSSPIVSSWKKPFNKVKMIKRLFNFSTSTN
ncbi:uncharacterized protein LOC124910758 [Impatiens glandulifera]|uniref:uncharacterized protein LOC124910758 n=1 Tax=Impatiens glandulifera TaxID=253017 RepID=UPI001FB115C7|nr:uncharacterized protein LOC124910758 [Impatiens glandulifera]